MGRVAARRLARQVARAEESSIAGLTLCFSDAELNLRQPDFCTFRTIRTLCISWNIDACKPQDLSGAPQNLDFLRDVLLSTDSPDIISFGFQEMASR